MEAGLDRSILTLERSETDGMQSGETGRDDLNSNEGRLSSGALRLGPRASVFPEGSERLSPTRVGTTKGDQSNFKGLSHPPFDVSPNQGGDPEWCALRCKRADVTSMDGKTLKGLGPLVLQHLLEAVPLRSSTTGSGRVPGIFPLPTSRMKLSMACPNLDDEGLSWLVAICVSLNSIWGESVFSDRDVEPVVGSCLELLGGDVLRLGSLSGTMEPFDWDEFFRTRGIDYKGDEVKTARSFSWSNISPALPLEVGRVPLLDVCTLGAKHYVENFDSYLRPKEEWVLKKAPRVMVSDEDWPDVCRGLVSAGVCCILPLEDVFDTGAGPLLNGLFGVSKEEWHEGCEVFRLIMNLIPLNALAQPLQGDVETLPMWSQMNPYFLQPTEQLLISSEDVRCFFYTMAVPPCWYKYLAFNKLVPDACVPLEYQGRPCYLASKVLPMGFGNSVSLAQHVHRNLALWSSGQEPEVEVNEPEFEIRKDRPPPQGPRLWRIYLDNYDLLERVAATGVCTLEGTEAVSTLALRQEYEHWEVPRNLKKSVSRSLHAEVQGAQVDGDLGVAFPRESKLVKYLGAALVLLNQDRVSQKQLQVVCGGLVYVSMFRRQLLGCLNQVWTFVESFNRPGPQWRLLPDVCRLEILRFLSMIPLARLDFRMTVDEQVTCSDASTTGGGICASSRVSPWGALVSQGVLRGEVPESRGDHMVLTIGLFDGIGALRVAVDALGLKSIGHVSVELQGSAQRVVESHFPEVEHVHDVATITPEVVRKWSLRYSQAAVVLVGGGPPCQGVSGLNSDRKGALRDCRSCLYVHVRRVSDLCRMYFPWAQVHSLMESVASMDTEDRSVMSDDFGSPPFRCDAGSLTWCSRPRYYWVTWELQPQEGATIQPLVNDNILEIVLEGRQDLEEVCEEGWMKADGARHSGVMCIPLRTQQTVPVDGDGGFAHVSAMPKRVLEATTAAERAKQRRALGTLQQLTVQPATKNRYNKAIDKFLQFLNTNSLELPKQRHALDGVLCEYLEHLWSSGAGRALASDTVAGLQDQDAKLRGNLQGSWRLLKTWAVNEIPNRAPPLPVHVLHALVGWAFFHSHMSFGVSLLVGFYGMLRTGEILGLSSRHISGSGQHSKFVLSLGLTKSGKRQGAAESTVIGYDMVVHFLRLWKQAASDTTPLAPSPGRWRKLFNDGLEALKLTQFGFRPYSLRRGGATWWFARHHSLDKILLQGRWSAPKTARIYINEGLAVLAELQLPPSLSSLSPYLHVFTQAQHKSSFQTLEPPSLKGRTGGRGKAMKHRKPKPRFFLWDL
eukprot:Skav202357  [mRNA]  locus=scaffold53:218927:223660:- [translate_table: standard]